jgi:hypothetical protein
MDVKIAKWGAPYNIVKTKTIDFMPKGKSQV